MQQNLIDYWSYSSMASLLSNPLAFKKQYVLKVYDNITSPSALVGSAGHKALEMYYSGMNEEDAIAAGLKLINEQSDMGINYGKTGSREKIINTYTQAIGFYFSEMKAPHEILGVEDSITIEAKGIDGQPLPLPIKAKIDLLTRNKLGEIEIIDHKFVGSYSNGDEDSFKHWLQGMFNYHTVLAKYGEAPARIIFNECKVAKNTKDRAGEPQLQPYTYEFDGTADFVTFYRLFNEATELISRPDAIFLPNPNDIYDGNQMFELYRTGTIDSARPIAVPHKTEQVKFADKNFVPSALDRPENQHLTNEEKIRLKYQEFGVAMEMQETHVGPSITKYTMKPARGISMSKVASMTNDIALALGSDGVRIEAPIRGTSLVGVEVPNENRTVIELAEQHLKLGTMDIPVGVDVYGNTVHKDLADMPHLLIAGATGSGKSVMLNVLLQSLTRQMTADNMQLVLIDPKQVELAAYEGDSHLLRPVVTQPLDAIHTLDEMVTEMEKRYKRLARQGVRSIDKYRGNMPKIVIVVDEFADLMMSDIAPSVESMDIKAFKENLEYIIATSPTGKLTQKSVKAALKETLAKDTPPSAETSIIRIAQKARAVGMHLILATQRPSADVVTGLIKANIPTKIAFMTTSAVNSRIILDTEGAEKLTGKGDMLFLDTSKSSLQRLQGLYC